MRPVFPHHARLHLAASLVLVSALSLGSTSNAQVGSVIQDVLLDENSAGLQLTPGGEFGAALSNLGDLDGDGLVEFAVGNPLAMIPPSGSMKGAVQILDLLPNGQVGSAYPISQGLGGFTGTLVGGERFGSSIAALGDVNGDGTVDLAVGVEESDDGMIRAGAVWILFLKPDGLVAGSQKISATAGGFGGSLNQNDKFGASVASLGDIDGDSIPDLAVGAPTFVASSPPTGALWILTLNADGTVKSETLVDRNDPVLGSALQGVGQFGFSLLNLGDRDGDGSIELCVGAPGNGAQGLLSGSVFVLSIASGGVITGFTSFDLLPAVGFPVGRKAFGGSLAEIGDLDQDGKVEIAVGGDSSGFGNTPSNEIWIVSLDNQGVASGYHLIDPALGSTINRATSLDQVGGSLASLGDLDGDGVSDLLAGAPGIDSASAAETGGLFLLNLSDGDPTADFSPSVSTGCVPFPVTFTDLSTGTALSSWNWDFGDGGTSTQVNPVHTYTSVGTYTVSLTVAGADGVGRTVLVDLVQGQDLLAVDFTASPTAGTAPLPVAFDNLTNPSGVVAWAWDFGDGNVSTLEEPSHTYLAGGTFDVTLTATCVGGNVVETKLDYISVMNSGPASVTSFNGSGINPDVLTSSVDPVIGTTWMGEIDGGSVGATGLAFFIAYEDPLSGLFIAAGEVLVNPLSPTVVLALGSIIGGIAPISSPIPADPSLEGFTFSGQGLLNNLGGAIQLTNRLDFILGY